MGGFLALRQARLFQGRNMSNTLLVPAVSAYAHGPFQDMVGYQLGTDEQGRIYAKLPIRPDHLNLHGVLHGGVLLTLLDAIGGRVLKAADDRIQSVVTISLSADFIRPVGSGTLYATGKVDKVGKTIAYASVKITLDDLAGEVVAQGHSSWRVFIQKSLTKLPNTAI